MVVGSFVDTKQEALKLRRDFNKAFPKRVHHYCKTRYGYYYVWSDYPVLDCESEKQKEGPK